MAAPLGRNRKTQPQNAQASLDVTRASLARFDFAQFVFSPQRGSNKPAQGIALGIEVTLIHEALKGRHFGRSTDLVLPFQG